MKNSLFNHRLTHVLGAALAVVVSGGLTSCSDDLLTGAPEWLGSSIYEELESRGNFSTTLRLIDDLGQKDLLSRTGSRTVFVAPDDVWQEFFKKNAETAVANPADPWAGATSYEALTPSQKKVLFKSNTLVNANLIELLSNVQAIGNKKDDDGNPEMDKNMCIRHQSGWENLDTVTVFYNDDSKVSHFPKIYENPEVHRNDFWGSVRHMDQIKTMNNKHWTRVNNIDQWVEDAPMMLHFTPSVMSRAGMTDEDIQKLTGDATANVNSTIVNGALVDMSQQLTTYNVTCQNGYIHVLKTVPTPPMSMAQVIDSRPELSTFRELLDRYSYPQVSKKLTEDYNLEMYGQREVHSAADTIYVRRYFNTGYTERKFGSTIDYDPNRRTETDDFRIPANQNVVQVSQTLPYDPDWHRFKTGGSDIGEYTNIAVMIVPNNQVMEEMLRSAYSDIGDSWDKIPDNQISEIMRNYMKTDFLSSLPHAINKMKNESSLEMELTIDNIEKAYLCTNGVVYVINKQVTPPSMKAVSAPVNAKKCFTVLKNFISSDDQIAGDSKAYKAYLENFPSRNDEGEMKGCKYIFLAPTDNALKLVFDPATLKHDPLGMGTLSPIAYEFYFDEELQIVRAYAHRYEIKEGEGLVVLDTEESDITEDDLCNVANYNKNRSNYITNFWKNQPAYKALVEIMDNAIIPVSDTSKDDIRVNPVEQEWYKAKSGAPIRFQGTSDNHTIAAGLQIEQKRVISLNPEDPETGKKGYHIESIIGDGNGITYTVMQEPLLPTSKSPYYLLDSIPEFHKFKSLLEDGKIDSLLCEHDRPGVKTPANKEIPSDACPTLDKAIQILGNYNYTMYVPRDKTLIELCDENIGRKKGDVTYFLPNWEFNAKIQTVIDNVENISKNIPDADKEKYNIVEDVKLFRELQKKVKNCITNFLMYHIQDNSVYIKGEPIKNVNYESNCLNRSTRKFEVINVSADANAITLKDRNGQDHIISDTDTYIDKKGNPQPAINLVSRQMYMNKNASLKSSKVIYVDRSAYVVIHALKDGEYLELPYEDFLISTKEYAPLKEKLTYYTSKIPQK